MQVMHAYASMWMFMQVCECLCKYVNAYASMRMLMQVMCMLKCMFNMLCKLWECLYASSTCYARYVYDDMHVWVNCSWVNICSYMQVDILLTHDKVIC